MGIGALNHLNPGVSAMSSVPLHLERRCEQRWAARFPQQAPESSKKGLRLGQRLRLHAKAKGKPAELSRGRTLRGGDLD